MTRVLYLNGESDSYFAQDMQNTYTVKELVAMGEEAQSQGTVCEFYDEENSDYWIGNIQVLEFGEVDPKFIEFLYQEELAVGHDTYKHRDFIILD